jgi:hypothetical protein
MVVFVSYQRSDTLVAAHALGYALRLAGHRAFVDTGSIGAGELYRHVISEAVANANVMAALVGPSFDAARCTSRRTSSPSNGSGPGSTASRWCRS